MRVTMHDTTPNRAPLLDGVRRLSSGDLSGAIELQENHESGAQATLFFSNSEDCQAVADKLAALAEMIRKKEQEH